MPETDSDYDFFVGTESPVQEVTTDSPDWSSDDSLHRSPVRTTPKPRLEVHRPPCEYKEIPKQQMREELQNPETAREVHEIAYKIFGAYMYRPGWKPNPLLKCSNPAYYYVGQAITILFERDSPEGIDSVPDAEESNPFYSVQPGTLPLNPDVSTQWYREVTEDGDDITSYPSREGEREKGGAFWRPATGNSGYWNDHAPSRPDISLSEPEELAPVDQAPPQIPVRIPTLPPHMADPTSELPALHEVYDSPEKKLEYMRVLSDRKRLTELERMVTAKPFVPKHQRTDKPRLMELVPSPQQFSGSEENDWVRILPLIICILLIFFGLLILICVKKCERDRARHQYEPPPVIFHNIGGQYPLAIRHQGMGNTDSFASISGLPEHNPPVAV